MKKLTHIIKTGAFALLTSLSVAACIDGNDWETISDCSVLQASLWNRLQ